MKCKFNKLMSLLRISLLLKQKSNRRTTHMRVFLSVCIVSAEAALAVRLLMKIVPIQKGPRLNTLLKLLISCMHAILPSYVFRCWLCDVCPTTGTQLNSSFIAKAIFN